MTSVGSGKTFNGFEILAKMTGLSEAEIRWTWRRLGGLLQVDKMDRAEAIAIVKAEAKGKPWLEPPP